MRFNEFFIEYKIGLKSIGNLIPWKDSPMYRKVFSIIMLVVIVSFSLFEIVLILLTSQVYLPLFCVMIGIIVMMLIVLSIIDSSEKNVKRMLNNYYSTYSYKRMNMLKQIFQKYGLNVTDSTTIDLLIKEAEMAQKKNCFIFPTKGVGILGAAIASIIMFVAKKIAEEWSTDELVYMALLVILIIVCLILIIIAFVPSFQDIVYPDNRKYDDLIYDLRQLKIFYK